MKVKDLLEIWEPDRLITDRIVIHKKHEDKSMAIWDKEKMRWIGDVKAAMKKKVKEAWFGCAHYTLYILVEE